MSVDASDVVAHPRILLDSATLAAVRQRARDDDPSWIALREQCDFYLTGQVGWPDGDPYPDGGSIGMGYYGDEYYPALRAGHRAGIGPFLLADRFFSTESPSVRPTRPRA